MISNVTITNVKISLKPALHPYLHLTIHMMLRLRIERPNQIAKKISSQRMSGMPHCVPWARNISNIIMMNTSTQKLT